MRSSTPRLLRLLLLLTTRLITPSAARDAYGRCLKGTLDCLDAHERAEPREWQTATTYDPSLDVHAARDLDTSNATLSLLDALLETVSFAIEEAHQHKPKIILGDRIWWGMGMVGNKFAQAHSYFEMVRAEARRKAPLGLTICEVGLNGGHSAVVFLEAAGRGATLQMFDGGALPYTATAIRLVERLYPKQMHLTKGDSRVTTPKFASERGRVCDVMSIDGGHEADVITKDLDAAIKMSKPGALLLLDDMNEHLGKGRPVIEKAARDGVLNRLRCVPDRVLALPKATRFSSEGQAKYIAHAWCHARLP